MIIVTGGIASGKSTFEAAVKELGYTTLDADKWYKGWSQNYLVRSVIQEVFGTKDVDTEQFGTLAWDNYERYVDSAFFNYISLEMIHGETPEFLFIPDYPNRHFRIGGCCIVNIRRMESLEAALKRDTHRSPELTTKLFNRQSTNAERVGMSHYTIDNESESEYKFKKFVQHWVIDNIDAIKTGVWV